jgi:RNA-directed DNA polymerase
MKTRQESDDPVVPDGGRKVVGSGGSFAHRGGKGVAVDQRAGQLGLPFATAGNAAGLPAAALRSEGAGLPAIPRREVPKAKSKEDEVQSATMEGVVGGLSLALEKVAANDGAPGPDRQSVTDVRKHAPTVLPALAASLLDGSYRPGDIRRVWIPKGGGGQRGLGIPNVVDRVVQEATRAVLEPLWEPTFHPSSHGFRPGRSCHTAIAEAKRNVEEGYGWVVDIDLEKFFDKVHHQRLMARVATRVSDRRLLVLLGQMLKAEVVMPDGVKVSTEQGVPQGGPLSPLLSNIVLDELDSELAERELRFVRYADDCNIYVRSERAGQRVMASITSFIAKRLRLTVNAAKSAVARPETRHFLGFRLRVHPETSVVEVLMSARSLERVAGAIRQRTPRNWGGSLESCISGVNVFLRGWFGFFSVCTGEERTMSGLDAHIRRRLRAILLIHWKNGPTIARNLIAMGIRRKTAWATVYDGRRGTWHLSHRPAVDRALDRAFFARRKLVSLGKLWESLHRPVSDTIGALSEQLSLFGGWTRS